MSSDRLTIQAVRLSQPTCNELLVYSFANLLPVLEAVWRMLAVNSCLRQQAMAGKLRHHSKRQTSVFL